MKNKFDEEYVGDGIYVYHDGYCINITTHNGLKTTNDITIEMDVFVRILEYVMSRLKEDNENILKIKQVLINKEYDDKNNTE